MGVPRTSSSTPPGGPATRRACCRFPSRLGPRKDVAHFAHFEGFSWDDAPGQVLINRARAGLELVHPAPGAALHRDRAGSGRRGRLGRTPEERLERAIANDPWLFTIGGDAKRVTDVATYANYQLISERGYGRGWVMVGDAFGFIDPMLSPGVFSRCARPSCWPTAWPRGSSERSPSPVAT